MRGLLVLAHIVQRGTVSPETLTNGSSAQRVRWFNAGHAAGPDACSSSQTGWNPGAVS
jgi:predicted metalloprotease